MTLISERRGNFATVKRYEINSSGKIQVLSRRENDSSQERNGDKKYELQDINGNLNQSQFNGSQIGQYIWRQFLFLQSASVAFFKRVFLPQGYPQSVSSDYLEFQFWDTIQDFSHCVCTAWRTEATLRVVGVGDATASALASTITLLLRDGTDKLTKVACLWIKGDTCHRNNKKWRLFADILQDILMLIQILTPALPPHLILVAFYGTGVGKIFVEVASKSSRAMVLPHLARLNNTAEVTDKEWIQSTATRLLALIGSIIMLKLLHNDIRTVLTVYTIYASIHIYGNYRLMKTLRMRSFNEARLLIAIKNFLLNGQVPSIRQVNDGESVFLGFGISDVDVCGYSIKLGSSLQDTISGLEDSSSMIPDLKEFSDKYFLIILNAKTQLVHVILREGISPIQMIEGYFRAVLAARAHALTGEAAEEIAFGGMDDQVTESWERFLELVKAEGFETDVAYLKNSDYRFEWKSE